MSFDTEPPIRHFSSWTVWTDATDERKAQKVLNRVETALAYEVQNVTIEPYMKGGHTIGFQLSHNLTSWSNFVVEVIAIGQRIASGWVLYGRIFEDPEGLSNRVSVSGVKMITWRIGPP